MKSTNTLLPFLILLFLWVGCSNSKYEDNSNSSINLLTSEKNLPSDFYKIAFQRQESPHFEYLVKKAETQKSYEKIWNLYNIGKQIPKVNFNEKNVLFIGVQESGTCPYELEDIEIDTSNKAIKITLSEPEGPCTSDATPRTFVIEIDKKTSDDLQNVRIVQSGVETSIPVD